MARPKKKKTVEPIDRSFEKLPSKDDGKKIIPDTEVEAMIQKIKSLTYGQVLVVKKAATERFAQVR